MLRYIGNTPQDYLTTTAINEIKWARAYAKPCINPHRSLEVPEAPDAYISLLDRYLQLILHLSPEPYPTSLFHPDLHLDNILVDSDIKIITRIID
jgi:aminoglycoside phosphotransferase (APT) family kinase protein